MALALHCSIYVLTGVYGSLCTAGIIGRGAGDVRAGVLPLATFAGVSLSSFFVGGAAPSTPPSKSDGSGKSSNAKWYALIVLLALLEIAGSVLCAAGFAATDAGTFGVLCASSLVFAAGLNVTLLGKTVSKTQLLGVAAVTLGLALSAVEPPRSDTTRQADTPSASLLAGSIYTLAGCFLYALACAAIEHAIARSGGIVTGQRYAQLGGGLQTLLVLAYVAGFVVADQQRAETLLWTPIHQRHSTVREVGMYLALLVANNVLRSVSYMRLLQRAGSVVVSLLGSLVPVGVFAAQAILYCESPSTTPGQCLHRYKVLSGLFVVAGSLLYSLAPAGARASDAASAAAADGSSRPVKHTKAGSK